MTSRIGKPDTDADIDLRACLDQDPVKSFIMVAGAGSGKTTSLIKALDHLAKTRGDHLKRRGQRVACITYTEVAVSEIWGDVGNAPLFHVSTIHSFLWSVVSPFQADLKDWVRLRIGEKIADAEARFARPGTRPNTRIKLEADLERYADQLAGLDAVPYFKYGTGSDYLSGVLGHSDILKVGPYLITERPLLRMLITQRFPFIFVDESQDTDPDFVAALRLIAEADDTSFCLGFFGDAMQKIYVGGAGQIERGEGWEEIEKPENFRCPTRVLSVINAIRAEDDGLHQIRGRRVMRDGIEEPVEGTARIFVMPADDRRQERLAELRTWLAETNNDPLWSSDDEDGDVRLLVIVHRMAARRLGFPDLYASLNDNAPSDLKDGLLDGTAWVLRPFMGILLPLAQAQIDGDNFEVMNVLRKHSPLLQADRLQGQDVEAVLGQLREDIGGLVTLMNPDDAHTIGDVLNFVQEQSLIILDERFTSYLGNEPDGEEAAVQRYLACPASQLWGYRTYIEDESPFATQQGIKGAEFERVLVVLDDEEGRYNLFSYGKYFGITPLSANDEAKIADGEDSVIGRTRRLFYVCCSRAIQDLAVAFFVPVVIEAREAVLAKGFFTDQDVHVLDG